MNRITRSITVKWLIALVLTSLAGVVLIAVFVNVVIGREFDRLVIAQSQETFAAESARYFALTGSWEGAAEAIRPPEGQQPPGDGQYQRPEPRRGNPAPDATTQTEGNNSPELPDGSDYSGGYGNASGYPPPYAMQYQNYNNKPMYTPGLILVDADGKVIIGSGRYQPGDTVNDYDIEDQTPILVDGAQVGTVLFTGGTAELDTRQQIYIQATNTAILIGALGAIAVSALVGILLSGALLRPLRALTHAVIAMHAGELEQRVEVKSHDEIGELASAFNDMSARLARANHLRKQMTADIAHDLRSPLTVLSGYLEGMRDGTLKPTPARFETMHNEALQLGRLIDDLRTLSLADAGELRLMRQSISPRDLLEGAAAAYQPGAAARGIALNVDISADLPTVQIDRERMSQVLGNLVGNAMRYAKSRITLKAISAPDGVRISVEDDGAGIPAEKLPYIFERFYRADESRHASEGESGLGLAIARSIVEAHGGTIRAESQLGQGTSFLVSVPV